MQYNAIIRRIFLTTIILGSTHAIAMHTAPAFIVAVQEHKTAVRPAFTTNTAYEIKAPQRQTMTTDDNDTTAATCRAYLCKCPCLPCTCCDHAMSRVHESAISESNNGGPFSCLVVYCTCCGCIGYCHKPCRYCASCAETPDEGGKWHWTHDPEVVWQWYKDNCCQCPDPNTMPHA